VRGVFPARDRDRPALLAPPAHRTRGGGRPDDGLCHGRRCSGRRCSGRRCSGRRCWGWRCWGWRCLGLALLGLALLGLALLGLALLGLALLGLGAAWGWRCWGWRCWGRPPASGRRWADLVKAAQQCVRSSRHRPARTWTGGRPKGRRMSGSRACARPRRPGGIHRLHPNGAAWLLGDQAATTTSPRSAAARTSSHPTLTTAG